VNPLDRAERWLSQVSLRERVLVAVALAGVSLALWDGLVLRPAQARAGDRSSERGRLQEALASAAQRRALIEAALASDPAAPRRARLDELAKRSADLDSQIRESASGLIPPAEMTRVLRALLAARPGLRVLRLEGAPAEPLVDPKGSEEAPGPALQPIYRHALRLEIEASFAETAEFLRAVEALPWKFSWDELRYEVATYPTARVTLVVHTFSDREGWVGA
jgi:MSHA biogenesis protein MshJ